MTLGVEILWSFLFVSTLAAMVYLGRKLDSLQSMLYNSVNHFENVMETKSNNGNKVGAEVYVHGYIDEIRKDVIIIRNSGGYFGTVRDEVTEYIPPIILDDILNEYGLVTSDNAATDQD